MIRAMDVDFGATNPQFGAMNSRFGATDADFGVMDHKVAKFSSEFYRKAPMKAGIYLINVEIIPKSSKK